MNKVFLAIFLICGCLLFCQAQDTLFPKTSSELQPMVVLFGTNSFVPSLPLKAYQSCDACLGAAILARNCRLRGRAEADQALARMGVVRLGELNAAQAKALMAELNSVALVQLTITEYRLQSARRQGNRPQKNLPGVLQIANLGGEIQIWSQGDTEVKTLSFHKVLTDQDPNLSCVPGECDKNSFGMIALQYALEQAMQEFSK